MRKFGSVLSFAVLICCISGCNDSGIAPGPVTGIQGQVYSIATPGPTPVGWTPPPLEKISTLLVLDSNHKTVFEILTDNKGRFSVGLNPGTYFLRVKESMIPAETGPWDVTSGEVLSVKVDYDNGMR